MNKSTCLTLKSETGLWKRKYCSFFLPLAATSQMYRHICLEQLVDRHGAVSQEHKTWMPMPIVFMLQQIFNLVVFFSVLKKRFLILNYYQSCTAEIKVSYFSAPFQCFIVFHGYSYYSKMLNPHGRSCSFIKHNFFQWLRSPARTLSAVEIQEFPGLQVRSLRPWPSGCPAVQKGLPTRKKSCCRKSNL